MAKWITVKYLGSTCKACGNPLEIGTRAKWYRPGVAYHEATWEYKTEKAEWVATGCKNVKKAETEEAPPF